MRKSSICIVVPAYNEEKVIEASLKALKKVIDKKHIYVVSDGSSDKTALLALRQQVNVMNLRKNVGKARALQKLMQSRHLFDRYQYLLFSDADSRLIPDFIKIIKRYIKDKPACLAGTVLSDRKGLISAFRTYEYGLTHRVFKQAQNTMHVVTVAPGCASLYRSDVLEKLNFFNHTLTEDFDLTVQIYQQGLGRIVYVPKAKVITQDPLTFKDYWKQIVRWYTGVWQNIFLHHLYIPNNKLSAELYLVMLDGLFALVSLVLTIIYPLLFLETIILMFLTLYSISILMISLERRWWALVYVPLFPTLYIISLVAYGFSFFRAIFGRNRRLSWQKVARYSVAN